MSFIIENLLPKHYPHFKNFKCKNPSMEGFLVAEALKYHVTGEGITKIVKVEEETDEIIAYYTLKCDTLKYTDPEMHESPRYIPCIEVARIAVLSSWQNGKNGIHLGTELMEHIITYVKEEIATNIGCRFITLHAVIEKVKWYQERLQFKVRVDERTECPDDQTLYMSLDLMDNQKQVEFYSQCK